MTPYKDPPKKNKKNQRIPGDTLNYPLRKLYMKPYMKPYTKLKKPQMKP